MRAKAGLIAVVVLLAAGPVGVARADTRVTNDTAGNYKRYDGLVDATMTGVQHRYAAPRTSPALPSTRAIHP